MKILLINTFHYRRSGAETAYFDMAKTLEAHGHEVAFFAMQDKKNEPTKWDKYFVDNVDYNAEKISLWQKMRMAGRLIFNFQSYRNLEKLIAEFQPDVAHLHNIYHQLSPSVIYALKKHKVPMVLTLHDYKLVSINYNLFLHGKIWEKKARWACVQDKCVKDSYLKSALGALEKLFHDVLRSYANIDVFISPSRFLMNKFKDFGFSGKLEYIPNPLDASFYKNENLPDSTGSLLYYGRLSTEKGIDTAIRAVAYLPQEKLQIVGEGPEKNNLMALTKEFQLEDRVEFLGFKSGTELTDILQKSKAIIFPSVWYENMPYSIVEPLAMGKIIIASNIGGIPDLITDGETGLLFEAGNANDLAQKIKSLEERDSEQMKIKARKKAAQFSSEKYYEKIMQTYENIVSKHKE